MSTSPAPPPTNGCAVVYVGLDDFPLGLAQTQKVRLVSRGLIHAGCHVTVLSRWWSVGDWKETPNLAPAGVFEGISYINACGHLYRPRGFFYRKWVRVRGLVNEIRILARLRREGRLDAAILSGGIFSRVIYYSLMAKIFGIPLILQLVEYYTAYAADGSWKDKVNARLMDRAAFWLIDGAMPISRFLIDRVERYARGLPWHQDPGLVDLSRFDGLERHPGKRYLVFCGYLGYMEIVRFCMLAFEQAESGPDVELHLVVNGAPRDFERLERERTALSKGDRIVVRSGITDRELSQLYMNAYALLIPLRPTDQDRARFPHKIGEYCGSRRPVITTAIGEIIHRFRHGVNAYIAPHYDVMEFARVIEECLADPERAAAVGAAGRKLAEEMHDFRCFGPGMRQFVMDVIARCNAR